MSEPLDSVTVDPSQHPLAGQSVSKEFPIPPGVHELWTKAQWDHYHDTVDFHTSWSDRNYGTKNKSWFILTREVADILGEFLKNKAVIEVMAGTGHLAYHLRQTSGLDRKQYKAYDIKRGYGHRQYLPGVTTKNAFMAPIKKADVVIMTWPGYDDNHAYRVAKKMLAGVKTGQWLIYQGEGYGGCTGDDNFHDLLASDFRPNSRLADKLNDHHSQFWGVNDRWYVYKKIK